MTSWTRGLVALCALGLMSAPGFAWTYDPPEENPLLSTLFFSVMPGAPLSTIAACSMIFHGKTAQMLVSTQRLGCLLAIWGGPSTTSSVLLEMSLTALQGDADEETKRQEATKLVLGYVRQEADALADEVALGSGAHVPHMTGWLQVVVGGPVDVGQMRACLSSEREALWGELAQRGEGYALATLRFIECAETSGTTHITQR